MKNLLTLLALAVALPAAAAQNPTLETAAANMKETVKTLKAEAKSDKTDFSAAAMTGIYVDMDCEKVTFKAGGPNVSGPIALLSRTWMEECRNIPLPNPPGGGMCIPEPRRLMFTDTANAVIELAERASPAADETFEVCLWGRSLSLRAKKTSAKYTWGKPVNEKFTVTLKK